jgi:hypothetical protein
MADLQLRIPPSGKRPSYLNRSMAAGLIGSMALPVGVPTGLALMAIMATAGAYFGKKEQEKEEKEGRVISEPGMLKNEAVKDGLIGLGLGSIAGGLAAVGIGMVAAFMLISAGTAATAAAVTAAVPAGVVMAMTAVIIGAPILGGLLGLNHGKKRMEYQWKAAKDYVAANGEYKAGDISQSQGKEVTQERYKDTVTPDEYRAMQEKMAAGKPRSETAAIQLGR